jgi:NADPH:quinone reductase
MERENKRINQLQAQPRSGKAIRFDGPGGPEVLACRLEIFDSPGRGEVSIQVRYAGVNRPDLLQRLGLYPAPSGQNPHLGLEVSGVIDALGEGVPDWAVGARVAALTNGGGYGAFVNVPAGQVMAIPDAISDEAAAALPETALTVFANVFAPMTDPAARTLLIHGGASGIGTMGIAMARAAGWRVAVTARSHEKHERLRALGAWHVFGPEEDWVGALKADGGVDVVLDMIGGESVGDSVRVLNPGGRLAFIAFLGGSKPSLDLMPVMLKRLVLTGSTLRSRSAEEKARLVRGFLDRFGDDWTEGRLAPAIDTIFALEEAAKAHARLDSGAHFGKVLLRVDA